MDDALLLSIFVAVEGAHAFSAFMPSYFTVKKFASGEKDTARLRSGYVPALAFNLVLGGTVSAISKDKRPVIFSVIVSLAMVALYERAIRS
jgi:hypothetical protein